MSNATRTPTKAEQRWLRELSDEGAQLRVIPSWPFAAWVYAPLGTRGRRHGPTRGTAEALIASAWLVEVPASAEHIRSDVHYYVLTDAGRAAAVGVDGYDRRGLCAGRGV